MKTRNAIVAAAALTAAIGAASAFAAAGTVTSAAHARGFGIGQEQKNVTRTVENVDNGVVITLAGTDADAVKAIQERAAKRPVETVTNTADGVKITITSPDSDEVKRLQKRESGKGFGPGMGKGRGPRGESGSGAKAPIAMDKVTRTVANVDNGVTVTMTTDDATVLAALQSDDKAAGRGFANDSKVTFTKENVANGVKLTITSTDASEVKKIQEREANMGKFAQGMMNKGMGRGMRGQRFQSGSAQE